MGALRFVAPGFSQTVELAPGAAHGRTLLAIAREHGIPILFNCEAGGCAACIVRVEVRGPEGAGGAAGAEMSFEEELVLAALGKLPPAGLQGAEETAAPQVFRLACQYRPGDADLVVDFTNELGGA